MAILCKKYGLLYIQIGGTGSTSVGRLLTESYGGEQFPREETTNDLGNTINRLKHITIPEIIDQGHATEEELDKYLKVASIRNPFDFLVSAYSKDKLQKLHGVRDKTNLPEGVVVPEMEPDPKDFEEWILNRFGMRRKIKDLVRAAIRRRRKGKSRNRLAGVDRVIRFENMLDDLNAVLEEVGAPAADKIGNRNPSYRARDYQRYYTPRARKLAEKGYWGFLSKYPYDF